MRRRTAHAPLAALAIAGLCLLGPLAARADAQPRGGNQSASAESTPPPTIDLDFGGGTIAEYVTALKDAAGDIPVNVVVSGDPAGVQLPQIALENVTIETAVGALEHMRSREFQIEVRNVRQHAGPTNAGPDDSSTVYVVTAWVERQGFAGRRASGRAGVAEEPPQKADATFAVFSLQQLLEAPDREEEAATAHAATLLTAVDTALALAGDADEAQIKFHPDSGLLIVRGTERQTDLVSRVIGEVGSDVHRRRSELRSLRAELAAAKTQLQKAEVRFRTVEGELDLARAELEQMGQLQERGMVSEGELRQARLRLQQMEGEREVAQLELEQHLQQMDMLRDRINAYEQRMKMPTTAEAVRAEIDRLEKRLGDLRARLGELEGRRRDRGGR